MAKVAARLILLLVIVKSHQHRQPQPLCLDADGAQTDPADDPSCLSGVTLASRGTELHLAEASAKQACGVAQHGQQRCLPLKPKSSRELRHMMGKSGYLVLPEFVSPEIALQLRRNISQMIRPGHTLAVAMGPTGFVIPSWHRRADFSGLLWLLHHPPLLQAIRMLVPSFRFLGQSEISFNDQRTWHQDRLNGRERELFERASPWADGKGQLEQWKIYKALFYLQDHSKGGGLEVVPGSHLSSETPTNASTQQLLTVPGDLIIFDQRIWHQGQPNGHSRREDRVLITAGFGANDSRLSTEFEQGTAWRAQHLQDPKLTTLAIQPHINFQMSSRGLGGLA